MENVLEFKTKQEKIDFYIKKNPFNIKEKFDFDKKVKCIHCGKIFKLIDFTATKTKENEFICCKFFPKCDGSLIDFMDE